MIYKGKDREDIEKKIHPNETGFYLNPEFYECPSNDIPGIIVTLIKKYKIFNFGANDSIVLEQRRIPWCLISSVIDCGMAIVLSGLEYVWTILETKPLPTIIIVEFFFIQSITQILVLFSYFIYLKKVDSVPSIEEIRCAKFDCPQFSKRSIEKPVCIMKFFLIIILGFIRCGSIWVMNFLNISGLEFYKYLILATNIFVLLLLATFSLNYMAIDLIFIHPPAALRKNF